MNDFYNGYQETFLGTEIKLPDHGAYKEFIAPAEDSTDGIVKYVNYSLIQSSLRRFPIFTASNIDGVQFQKAPRKDNWRTDDRIARQHQWGPELYKAAKSDFDKGHMTKREDVQWGATIALASLAADSTFHYTNAVPQHADLNQKVWRSLEDYILHTETRENNLRVAVFTGPVLHEKDPVFVTEVGGQKLQVPVIFWKIVYFKKADGKLYRAGFMMSQNSLLLEDGIIEERMEFERGGEEEAFMNFEDADTYQVNIGTIELLTKLNFEPAIEPFTDNRKIKLILKDIDVQESFLESSSVQQELGFAIDHLIL
jgi:endonuclease G